jgi:hypothetical protein
MVAESDDLGGKDVCAGLKTTFTKSNDRRAIAEHRFRMAF